jgi:hypothetical protein
MIWEKLQNCYLRIQRGILVRGKNADPGNAKHFRLKVLTLHNAKHFRLKVLTLRNVRHFRLKVLNRGNASIAPIA